MEIIQKNIHNLLLLYNNSLWQSKNKVFEYIKHNNNKKVLKEIIKIEDKIEIYNIFLTNINKQTEIKELSDMLLEELNYFYIVIKTIKVTCNELKIKDSYDNIKENPLEEIKKIKHILKTILYILETRPLSINEKLRYLKIKWFIVSNNNKINNLLKTTSFHNLLKYCDIFYDKNKIKSEYLQSHAWNIYISQVIQKYEEDKKMCNNILNQIIRIEIFIKHILIDEFLKISMNWKSYINNPELFFKIHIKPQIINKTFSTKYEDNNNIHIAFEKIMINIYEKKEDIRKFISNLMFGELLIFIEYSNEQIKKKIEVIWQNISSSNIISDLYYLKKIRNIIAHWGFLLNREINNEYKKSPSTKRISQITPQINKLEQYINKI